MSSFRLKHTLRELTIISKYFTAILIFFLNCTIAFANVQPNSYNVKDYGALGDGEHLDTDAINAAIEAASDAGGGIVVFPAGENLSFSIRLLNCKCGNYGRRPYFLVERCYTFFYSPGKSIARSIP